LPELELDGSRGKKNIVGMIRQRDIRETSNLQIDGYGGREERHCTTILELTGEQDDRVAAPARSLPWLVFAASDEGQPLGRHSHNPIARPAPVSPFIGSFSLSLFLVESPSRPPSSDLLASLNAPGPWRRRPPWHPTSERGGPPGYPTEACRTRAPIR
jgi:hypothetical protein